VLNRFGQAIDPPTLENWRTPEKSFYSFRNVREILPTSIIKRSLHPLSPFPYEPNPGILNVSFNNHDESLKQSVKEFLENSFTDVFLVLKDGKKVFEWVAKGVEMNEQHIMMSCSKSVLGLLCGVLNGYGLLDLNAPTSNYVPEVSKSAFGDATIRQLLDMEASYQFVEDYVAGEAYLQYSRSTGWEPSNLNHMGLYEYLTAVVKEGEHGKKFRYLSPTTNM
jgi:CubicO group peptidase (beta-lactamase class C family)